MKVIRYKPQLPKIQGLENRVFDSLTSLNKLLKNNDNLVGTNQFNVTIDWKGIRAEKVKALKKELKDLTSFANTYRHMEIAKIINDKKMNVEEKKKSISNRIKLLEKFYKNNTELDLRSANFFEEDSDTQRGSGRGKRGGRGNGNGNGNSRLNWKGITDDEKVMVRKQLMSYQRILYLADDTPARQTLLSKGYDSAISITDKSEDEFVESSGLETGKARMIFSRAQEALIRLTAEGYTAAQKCRLLRSILLQLQRWLN